MAEQVRTPAGVAVAVELDVILAGEIPMPYPYVFRPAGGNVVARLPRLLRPEGKALPQPIVFTAWMAGKRAAGLPFTVIVPGGRAEPVTVSPEGRAEVRVQDIGKFARQRGFGTRPPRR